MTRTIRSVIVLLVSSIVLSASPGIAAPLTIRIGWNNALAHPQPLIDLLVKTHPELFHHYGKDYVVESSRFQGGSQEIQAIAAGDLDVIAFAPSAFDLAVTNAHLDLRIVADVLQEGVKGYGDSAFIVHTDSPIRTVEDLKGKRLAVNAIGSSEDAALRTMLHRHGIHEGQYTEIEANFAAMPAMIEDGKVDMIAMLANDRFLVNSGKYRILFTMTDAVGPEQTVLWAMREDFIAAHRPVLVDFFADHLRALRWLMNPAHHATVVDMLEKLTRLPRARLEFAFTKSDLYRSPDGIPNLAASQHEIDEMYSLKLLNKRVALQPNYVDLSLVRDAARRLATHNH